jgi:E3 ubiquitin-protein ligase RNF220
MALRDVTRDEDDLSVVGKGKGRSTTSTGQCPVCLQDVDGDLDVITAHIDACLVCAELQQPASSIVTDADGDAPLNIDDYGSEGDSDMWEETETPDGVRRLQLRAGARNRAIALGLAVGDPAVDDVDDEIDVEGDDLNAFGAAQFTEADVLAEPSDSELSRRGTVLCAVEDEVDSAIERARHGKDSKAHIAALESKVQLLMVRRQLIPIMDWVVCICLFEP